MHRPGPRLRHQGDAGIRTRRGAVARLGGRRPRLGGTVLRSRPQLRAAGRPQCQPARPRLGPGRTAEDRSRSRRPHIRRIRSIQRPKIQRRGFLQPFERRRAHVRQAAADHAERREPAFRSAGARCRRVGVCRLARQAQSRTGAARNEKYPGAALAFAWSSDHGAGVSDTRIAHDNTCECCRLGVAFAGPGRPAIVFRNIFGEMVRDHAVMTFADRQTPGPVYRVSVDDWATEACPHHGPSLAIARDGSYHVAWFTNGRARRGLFYARSTDGGQTFSESMPIGRPDRAPSHPYLIATDGALWLAWKEFDGEETSVPSMVSHDNGRTWSAPKVAAKTSDSSDLPLLATDGRNAFLSWQTKADGYRLMPLEATQ